MEKILITVNSEMLVIDAVELVVHEQLWTWGNSGVITQPGASTRVVNDARPGCRTRLRFARVKLRGPKPDGTSIPLETSGIRGS